MSSVPRPLAIGLVHHCIEASDSALGHLRVALSLHANREGYALIAAFEVGRNDQEEDAAFQALEDLAVRLDADAVIVSGPVDAPRVEELADRLRLMVLDLPGGRLRP